MSRNFEGIASLTTGLGADTVIGAAGAANDSVNIGILVGIVLADLATLATANFVVG